MNDRIQKHKKHRLSTYDYSSEGVYHVNANTKYRTEDFGIIIQGEEKILLSDAGKILEEEWYRTAEIRPDVTLGVFRIMPDHFHGIITIGKPVLPEWIPPEYQQFCVPHTKNHKTKFGPQRKTLGRIVGSIKGATTSRVQNFLAEFEWQISFYDTIIRDMVQLRNTEAYIRNNINTWKRGEH